ncbi:Dual oxidase [Temnothorax longispinosus]|uniref:Dual oxidase n=1 Tax=Temnothorax longispinosus TaxID=300112 RepID=A0A4S2KJ80_9HYME|nr:Dual oxidase [Temnothorax longispinosus]
MTRRRPPAPARSIAPLCAIAWAFWLVLPAETGAGPSYADNKQRYDGFYNNLIHPDWGAIGKYSNLCTESQVPSLFYYHARRVIT